MLPAQKQTRTTTYDGRMYVQLELIQYIESSRSYSMTLSFLRQLEPAFVAVVSTPSPVNQACKDFKMVQKPRSSFDDTNGHSLIDLYGCSSAGLSGNPVIKEFYLAYGAAGALLEIIEEDFPFKITPGSLCVTCRGHDDFLQIDCATAQVSLP
jgi:hypothetical protein